MHAMYASVIHASLRGARARQQRTTANPCQVVRLGHKHGRLLHSIRFDASASAAQELLKSLQWKHKGISRMGGLWQHGCDARIYVSPSTVSLLSPSKDADSKTAWGSARWRLDYSRMAHTRRVLESADTFLAHRKDIETLDALALRLAAMFHGTGHLALSHAGDALCNEICSQDGTREFYAAAPEVRSANLLKEFVLYDSHGEFGLLGLWEREREELWQTCAWLLCPTVHTRPAHTSFQNNPLYAVAVLEMDIDRCSYLSKDAPPCLQDLAKSAQQQWLTHDCKRSAAFLARLRLLLQAHVYPAINQALLHSVKTALVLLEEGEQRTRLVEFLRDARLDSPKFHDIDLLPNATVPIVIPHSARNAFLALRSDWLHADLNVIAKQ